MESPVDEHEQPFYLVTHLRPDTEPDAMVKVIGLFDSLAAARSIVNEYKSMPGFRRYPEAFWIEALWLNRRLWEGGFFSGADEP